MASDEQLKLGRQRIARTKTTSTITWKNKFVLGKIKNKKNGKNINNKKPIFCSTKRPSFLERASRVLIYIILCYGRRFGKWRRRPRKHGRFPNNRRRRFNAEGAMDNGQRSICEPKTFREQRYRYYIRRPERFVTRFTIIIDSDTFVLRTNARVTFQSLRGFRRNTVFRTFPVHFI